MPGCTVPFCTNSTSKGFKVYHFPREEERCLLWVKNCGKGQNWQPTNHTCICEVHFEDSQFESHRADGVRKLKPNAVPTIFKKKSTCCYTRKHKNKDVKNNERLPGASYVQLILDRSSNTTSSSPEVIKTIGSLQGPEVLEEISLHNSTSNLKVLEVFADHTYPKVKEISDMSPYLISSSNETKEITQFTNHPSKVNFVNIESKRRNVQVNETNALKTVAQQLPLANHHFSTMQGLRDTDNTQCYICGTVAKRESCTLMNSYTDTSKIYFYKKINDIIPTNLSPSMKKHDVLCSHCTRLLNRADKIEIELEKIKETITKHLSQKAEVVPLLDSSANAVSNQPFKHIDLDFQYPENTDRKEMSCSDIPAKEVQRIQCLLCCFKTPYKSFMLHHLRQHLNTCCWCDFCKRSLQRNAYHDSNDSEQNNRVNNKDHPSESTIFTETSKEIGITLENSEIKFGTENVQHIEQGYTNNVILNTSSQLLVVPLSSDLQLCTHDIDMTNDSNACSYEMEVQAQSQSKSCMKGKVSKYTCSIVPTLIYSPTTVVNSNIAGKNAKILTETPHSEFKIEGNLIQARADDPTSSKPLQSLHELSLFDMQAIADSDGSILSMDS